MAYNPDQNTEFKSGNTPTTGTLMLGSIFEAEFNRIYANFVALFGIAGTTLTIDTISEQTVGNGIDIESVHIEDGVITVSDTTESTTKNTGSIITEGGIGAEKNIVNGGYLYAGKGRKPTGVLHGLNISQNTIFDALSPSLPNIGDCIIISGAIGASDRIYGVSYAERDDATYIHIYTVHLDISDAAATCGIINIEDGSAISYGAVSLCW